MHLGGDIIDDDFECKEELISFLDSLYNSKKNLELIILGDFLDLWKIDLHPDEQVSYIIKQHNEIFKKLKRFGEKYKITVIPGNHDHALVYNKKYKDQLLEYNIHVNDGQYFKREFKKGEKVFKIIGEHGNQIEPGCKFPDFAMPTDSSLSYHVTKLVLHRVMKMKNKKAGPKWVKDLDNIEIELIPYWVLSKYFYHELGPIFKSIMIPMLILFSFAVPFFIFDIVTDFYRPSFLVPFLTFIETNLIMKTVVFILYFDMMVVLILFFLSFVKKDFQKKLKDYYGLQSLTEILVSRENAYHKRAIEVMAGDNPYKQKAEMYINGHTHMSNLIENIVDNKIYADSGSWKQLMKRMSARFRFPSVYVPYYSLTYITCELDDDIVNVQLREWPKKFTPKLTLLEQIAIKRRKNIPKAVLKDTLIKEVNVPV